jgi:8-oxo-dGTP pyrophosphatase MutT (NUDIX family)
VELAAFAVVVVRHAGKYLLVHERNGTWYLPAGRLEPLESFADAAVRETMEESGVAVTLEGIYRVEHTPLPQRTRLRVIFGARPSGDITPRVSGDTLDARWFHLDELKGLPMRGDEVRPLLQWVENGATTFPLSLVCPEGTPLPR